MSAPNTEAALISVQEIAESILLKRGMTQHYWWRIVPLVCEAVQELSLTSMPTVRHTQIMKEPHETWFTLPKGFMDWVSVGIRIGNKWIPVGISERLMPYPNAECDGAEFSNAFSNKYRKEGNWKSWLNKTCKWGNADFFSDDFFSDDFSDTETTTQQTQGTDPYSNYGGNYYGYGYAYPFAANYSFLTNDIGEPVQGRFSPFVRPDEVTFNVEKGIIMCPDQFPSNILYLSYIGLGTADTLTYIPIKAQAVIEAYVEWKYAQNLDKKVVGLQEVRHYMEMYNYQHRMYRARNNNLTETVIRRIVDRGYIRDGWAYGSSGYSGGSYQPSTPIIYYMQQSFVAFSGSGGVTFVQNDNFIGRNIVYIIVGDTIKTSGYYVDNNQLIFTDGTEFYEPTKVVVYYEN